MDQPAGAEKAAWIAPSAELYGDIRLAEGVSVWPKVVMRAEAAYIQIGAFSNIQDFVMIHYGNDCPSIIGEYCSITHHATVHGATVGDHCLIGINATLMDGCVIGENSIVGAGAVVVDSIPANCVAAGNPAKPVKQLDPDRPVTTRAQWFDQPEQLFRAFDRYDREMLKKNRLWGWLRHLLFPTKDS